MWPTFSSRSQNFGTSPKLPVCALINDLQKKKCWASTRAHDPFFDILKIWPIFIYRGEVPGYTFAKLSVHVLMNDPKKKFRKKLYVTIPQWFETFPNMSDLWPGRNRAICGLQLNDPIDWLKLHLSQPKTARVWVQECLCHFSLIDFLWTSLLCLRLIRTVKISQKVPQVHTFLNTLHLGTNPECWRESPHAFPPVGPL